MKPYEDPEDPIDLENNPLLGQETVEGSSNRTRQENHMTYNQGLFIIAYLAVTTLLLGRIALEVS